MALAFDELFGEIEEPDRGDGSNQLAEELQTFITSVVSGDQRGQIELQSDEELTQYLHNRNFAKKGGHSYGKVVYSQPYTHWYRVQLDGMDGDIPCCRVTETSLEPFSVRDTSPISAGSNVLVWLPEADQVGCIVGVIPDQIEDGKLVCPDWVSQGSNVGFKREAYFHELFEHTFDDGGAIDFSNSRPMDSLSSGEWGRMTDLGGGFHLDHFMAFMRMDEMCGLFLYYMDRVTKLHGYNLDIRSAVHEMIARDDLGEAMHYSGFSPYSWEPFGILSSDSNLSGVVDKTDFDVQYRNPEARIEAANTFQRAFYRSEEYRGYLGQGFMRSVQGLPGGNIPYNLTGSGEGIGVEAPKSEVFPGLFREQIGLDGSYAISSAHSISITKRRSIAIPRRIVDPEDPSGDDVTAGDYSFASKTAGDLHIVQSNMDKDVPENTFTALQETMGLADFLAYAFEWKGLHPFFYHKLDFDLTNQPEVLMDPPNFTSLLNQSFLTPPTSSTEFIDHRYQNVEYFNTTSGIHLLPEGGVVIRGGGGEEIRMVGGSIQISCPGDVWLQPGRNVNMYCGDDLIAKANNSIDFSATNKDVRFKAEKNMEFLAANSGVGRMLFENKASAAFHSDGTATGEDIQGSGFIFKAENSQFVTAVNELYLRTNRNIVMDAGKGEGDILTVSNNYFRHLNATSVDTFFVEGQKVVANNFGPFNAQIHTPLQIDGGLAILKGGLRMKGNINVLGGHIGTTLSEAFDGKVGTFSPKTVESETKVFNDLSEDISKFKGDMTKDFKTRIEEIFYQGENAIGSESFQAAASFSWRTSQQMRTEVFSFAETYWQQLARITGSSPGVWTEKSITYINQKMMPHPGLSKWLGQQDLEDPVFGESESGAWLTQDLNLNDPITGKDAARTGLTGDSTYETGAEFDRMIRNNPDGKYPVTSN